jgi:ABC-type xylose transport system permease subunit
MKTIKNIIFWGIIAISLLAGTIIFILATINNLKSYNSVDWIFLIMGILLVVFLYSLHEQSRKER